jgi:Family of unknown function (DUF5330)
MQMVNARFPASIRYGFERVDALRTAFRRENHHQLKIYTESNESHFPRIFDDLSETQTLAIYRRLLAKTDTSRTSKNDWQDLIARVQPQQEYGRGREMFFLLRMAFWLGLVLVLLPRDKTPESDKLPQVGASEAVSAATAAVSDMTQFCKRQPAACQVGGQAAVVIGHRAQEGARKLYQIITDKRASDHTGSIGGVDDAGAAPTEMASRDTLTPDDLQAEWHAVPTP